MIGPEDIAVGVFRFIYRRKSPRPLPESRPRLQWFPKYRAPVELSGGILDAEEPDQALAACLEPMGFALDSWTPDRIRFARGKTWGDFSVKLIRLNLSLPHPLEREAFVELEVASVCLFDTGDVWKVCREVVERVEAGRVEAKSE
jgi:hypothetical protein